MNGSKSLENSQQEPFHIISIFTEERKAGRSQLNDNVKAFLQGLVFSAQ
ncbi:MAG: hypothetical protein ACTXOO_04810 [Sodalis sp. (in: enterobacteria)]